MSFKKYTKYCLAPSLLIFTSCGVEGPPIPRKSSKIPSFDSKYTETRKEVQDYIDKKQLTPKAQKKKTK